MPGKNGFIYALVRQGKQKLQRLSISGALNDYLIYSLKHPRPKGCFANPWLLARNAESGQQL
jgi:hypothetical protein